MEQRQLTQQKSRLGVLLVHQGLISRQQLDEALSVQARTNEQLGLILIKKNWLTARQLDKTLRRQSRARAMAMFSSAFFNLFQPLMGPNKEMVRATTSQQSSQSSTSPSFVSNGNSTPTVRQLSEQQAATNYERLLDIVNNNLHFNEEKQSINSLESLLSALLPGVDLLDTVVEIVDTEFEPGPRTTINPDGTLDVQLPVRIKQICLRNVRLNGSEGQHIGDVFINNLQFGESTSVKIQLHEF